MSTALDMLPDLNLRIQKFVYASPNFGTKRKGPHDKLTSHKSGPGRDDWTYQKILTLAGMHHSNFMPFLEGRYEAMPSIRTNQVFRLKRLLDQIESGMIELVNGEPVMKEEPTKRPDAIHRVAFLLSGRPVLKVAHKAPEAALTLKNPFKRG